VRRLSGFFADGTMLIVGNNRLIRLPKIALTGTVTVGGRDSDPQAPTGRFRAISNRIGDDLTTEPAQRDPNPDLIDLFDHK
jgi:hypothetical protein